MLKQISSLNEVIRLLPGNVYWKTRDNIFRGCNPNVKRILGEEIIGKADHELYDPVFARQAMENCESVMNAGVPMEFEECGFNMSGEMATYLSRKEPLRDEEGNVIGLIGTSLEITKYKKVLHQEFQENADGREADILKKLSKYIYDEFDVPLKRIRLNLTVVRSNLKEFLEVYQQLKSEDAIPECIPNDINTDELLKALGYNESIIECCVNFLKILSGNLGLTTLSPKGCHCQLIEETVRYAISGYPFEDEEERGKVFYERLKTDFIYYGDAGLLETVIHNLIKNALYYLQDRKDGKITVRLIAGDEYDPMNYISVRDNGPGISGETYPKIFARFFTTRANASGLGLAFCQAVMKVFKGRISCNTKVGEFTEFVLAFPKKGEDVELL